MKRVIVPLIALTIILLLGSCNSAKEVAYFQNADKVSLEASRMLYDAKIMPKDQLTPSSQLILKPLPHSTSLYPIPLEQPASSALVADPSKAILLTTQVTLLFL